MVLNVRHLLLKEGHPPGPDQPMLNQPDPTTHAQPPATHAAPRDTRSQPPGNSRISQAGDFSATQYCDFAFTKFAKKY